MTTTKSTRALAAKLHKLLQENNELAHEFGKNLVTHLSLPVRRGQCCKEVVQTLSGERSRTGLAREIAHVLLCSLD